MKEQCIMLSVVRYEFILMTALVARQISGWLRDTNFFSFGQYRLILGGIVFLSEKVSYSQAGD